MPEEISEKYVDIYEKLKKQIKAVEEEIEDLEESGTADDYPVKHQKAKSMIEEINEQISELDRAFDSLKEEEEEESD